MEQVSTFKKGVTCEFILSEDRHACVAEAGFCLRIGWGSCSLTGWRFSALSVPAAEFQSLMMLLLLGLDMYIYISTISPIGNST